MLISLVLLLAGQPYAPPVDLDYTLSVLKDTLTGASTGSLGVFFAEIGLEAAPDEILLWGPETYHELLLEFSDYPLDSLKQDSLFPLLQGLPLELLTDDTQTPLH